MSDGVAMKIHHAGSRRALAKAAASERVRDGAIRWLLWLRTADCTSAELDAFRHWRAQSPEHARAAYAAMWVWQTLGVLDDPRDAACELGISTFRRVPSKKSAG
jgi:ferric-dicitrate binding protein FerR (iron transport regulator)